MTVGSTDEEKIHSSSDSDDEGDGNAAVDEEARMAYNKCWNGMDEVILSKKGLRKLSA